MDTGEQTPLSSILNDEPSEVVETPQPEPEEQPEGPLRDESGRFAKKGEDGASPAPDEDPPFDHAAVKGERSRRQAAEQERDSLRTRLETLEQQLQAIQQPKEPPTPPPTIWEDEQGWQQHFAAQIAQQTSLNAKLDMSEMLARQSHEDFDAMKASFIDMANQNPALAQQALSDPHPWAKAYQIAKNAATMAELGATDVQSLKAKLREEVLAELQQGSEPVPQQQPQIPPTLTGERNVGARTGPQWSGPTPLKQLIS